MVVGVGQLRFKNTWLPLRYHPVQATFWDCYTRFIGLDCGRGSGKSVISRRKIVAQHLMNPNTLCAEPMYFYAAPTREQAKRLAWSDFQRLIPKEWLLSGTDGTNHSELVFRTIIGSSLHVVGLDRPQRIEGDQWSGGIIDESCDIKPGAFDLSILPALTWYRGFCWRIGVPKRQGPGALEFREFCEESRNGKIPDQISFTWPSAGIVPKEAVIYAQEHMDALDFAEQFGASWQRAGGGIFHAYHEDENTKPCVYHPAVPIIVGSDFNVDPMAWVLGHHFKDEGVVEWFDEVWIRDTNTPQTLEVLYAKYKTHKAGFVFYGDAAGRQRKSSAVQSDYDLIYAHEGFRKLGRRIQYPEANPPVADRFSACNAMFCNAAGRRRMFVNKETCPKLHADLKARYYKPGTREPADWTQTGTMIGHPSDAMGYVIHQLCPIEVPIQLLSGPISVFRGAK